MDLFLIHGVLMGVAWLVLLPLGVLIARFFKVTKSQDWPNELDNRFWWNSHRWLNYAGMIFATVGFIVIWATLDGLQLIGWHGGLGLITMALGWLQMISSWLRGSTGGPKEKGADPADPKTWRGDHYDMTMRRRCFEAWHKQAGYLALILAVPAAWLGLQTLGAPIWLTVLPCLSAGLFLLLFYRFSQEGRWVDTHQAIWGPMSTTATQSDNRRKREVS